MKRDELLLFLKDKISPSDHDELYLWTQDRAKRLFFFNTNFGCSLESGIYNIRYVSTGAYLGDGYIECCNIQKNIGGNYYEQRNNR